MKRDAWTVGLSVLVGALLTSLFAPAPVAADAAYDRRQVRALEQMADSLKRMERSCSR